MEGGRVCVCIDYMAVWCVHMCVSRVCEDCMGEAVYLIERQPLHQSNLQ